MTYAKKYKSLTERGADIDDLRRAALREGEQAHFIEHWLTPMLEDNPVLYETPDGDIGYTDAAKKAFDKHDIGELLMVHGDRCEDNYSWVTFYGTKGTLILGGFGWGYGGTGPSGLVSCLVKCGCDSERVWKTIRSIDVDSAWERPLLPEELGGAAPQALSEAA